MYPQDSPLLSSIVNILELTNSVVQASTMNAEQIVNESDRGPASKVAPVYSSLLSGSLSLSAENVRMMDGLYRLSYEGVPHPGNTVLKVEGSLMTFRDSPTGPLREVTLEYGQVN